MPGHKVKAIVAAAILLPLIVYGIVFSGGISTDHGRWADFGSYISGIYGALGFLGLIYSLHTTRTQFISQGQDTTFFNLWGALQNRISNASVDAGDITLHGQAAYEYVVEKIQGELRFEASRLARNIFCEDPEEVGFVHYADFSYALSQEGSPEDPFEGREEFIRMMKALKSFDERSEYLKSWLGQSGYETEAVREALCGLGSVHFYKVPFAKRRVYYERAFSSIKKKHGALIDGYFRNVCYLANHAVQSINAKEHVEYLASQLSRYELVLIFYCLAGASHPQKFTARLVESGVLGELVHFDCRELMIDMPSDEELAREIEHVESVG